MIADLEREPSPLPLLQFTLGRLWDQLGDQRTNGRLTLDMYRRIGGVSNAVSLWADEAVSTMEMNRALRVITRLVVVSDAGHARARVVDAETMDPSWADDLETLVRSGMILRQTTRAGAIRYRLLHPMLLDRWPRLAQTVNADRAFLALRQRVENYVAPAVRARASGFPPAFDATVVENAALLIERRTDLTLAEYQFVLQSIATVEQVRGAATVKGRNRALRRIAIAASTALVVGSLVVGLRRVSGPASQMVAKVLEKVSGDEQVMATADGGRFEVKAVTAAGQPASGAKIAWEIPACADQVFVATTDDRGIASVANPCPNLGAGKHDLKATLVDNNTPVGYQPSTAVKPLGAPVTFNFQIRGPAEQKRVPKS
jgi:hypothetical protein